MQRDFGTIDKPLWPLSSYGAGKYEPSFLPGLDISPEELRVQAVEALKEGKGAEYVHIYPLWSASGY
jgi:nucleoporin NUP42